MKKPHSAKVAMSARNSPRTLGQLLKHFIGLPSGQLLVSLTAISLTIRLCFGDPKWTDALIVLCMFVAWPFIEWFIHLFLLHFQPTDVGPLRIGPIKIPKFRVDPAVAQIHRAHHLHPWQLDHVMVPMRTYGVSLPANLLFWFGLFDPAQALTGLTMVFFFGLHYEFVHLMAHCRWKPPLGYYRRRWRNHRLHHCKSEKHWLGVTMLLADVVFGTGGQPSEVETSPTCRNLGQEETLGA